MTNTMTPSPLGMAVSTNLNRFQNHNEFAATESPQVYRGFSNTARFLNNTMTYGPSKNLGA